MKVLNKNQHDFWGTRFKLCIFSRIKEKYYGSVMFKMSLG